MCKWAHEWMHMRVRVQLCMCEHVYVCVRGPHESNLKDPKPNGNEKLVPGPDWLQVTIKIWVPNWVPEPDCLWAINKNLSSKPKWSGCSQTRLAPRCYLIDLSSGPAQDQVMSGQAGSEKNHDTPAKYADKSLNKLKWHCKMDHTSCFMFCLFLLFSKTKCGYKSSACIMRLQRNKSLTGDGKDDIRNHFLVFTSAVAVTRNCPAYSSWHPPSCSSHFKSLNNSGYLFLFVVSWMLATYSAWCKWGKLRRHPAASHRVEEAKWDMLVWLAAVTANRRVLSGTLGPVYSLSVVKIPRSELVWFRTSNLIGFFQRSLVCGNVCVGVRTSERAYVHKWVHVCMCVQPTCLYRADIHKNIIDRGTVTSSAVRGQFLNGMSHNKSFYIYKKKVCTFHFHNIHFGFIVYPNTLCNIYVCFQVIHSPIGQNPVLLISPRRHIMLTITYK